MLRELCDSEQLIVGEEQEAIEFIDLPVVVEARMRVGGQSIVCRVSCVRACRGKL